MSDESARRSRRAFVWTATGLSVLVVVTAFAVTSGVLAGAIAATRYSARFSGLVLAAAVVAHGPHPVAWSRHRPALTLAFVAAHGVHYATVILRALVEPGNRLRSFSLQAEAVVFLGLLLLALVAATATSTAGLGRRVNAIAFYVAWSVFMLASSLRAQASLASAVVLAALGAAMLWRIGSGVLQAHSAARAGS